MTTGPAPAAPARILVSDGETRQALALVRSLGARGFAVDVLAARRGSLAGVSRFARAEHEAPDPERDPPGWRAALRAVIAAEPDTLLVPVTEAAMGNLLASDPLPGATRVAAPPADAYAVAVDKAALLARAAAAGFAIPPTQLVEKPETLRRLPPGCEGGAVLKARRSRFLEAGRWQRGHALRVADDAALPAAVRDPGLRAGALLQPFVPGHGEGLFFGAAHGRVVATFAHRRLREKPPGGGVGVLVESRPFDEALRAPLERLVADLCWHGVGMLELRRTPEGRALVMELNPRLWGSLQLAIAAGADFPGLLLALHAGRPLPTFDARPGVRVRWTLGELDHLLIALRDREARRSAGLTRRAALAGFLAALRAGDPSDVWRRDDPAPFRCELRAWLRALRGGGSPA